MAILTKDQLLTELAILIKSGGVPSLTDAADVRNMLTDIIDTFDNRVDKTDYVYSALATPTGSAPTSTINLNSKKVISRLLNVTNESTGNVTLALTNAENGSTLTLHVTNSDSVSRTILLPSDAAHIDYSGNSKSVAIAASKSAVLGCTFTGSKYLWTLSVEE